MLGATCSCEEDSISNPPDCKRQELAAATSRPFGSGFLPNVPGEFNALPRSLIGNAARGRLVIEVNRRGWQLQQAHQT